MLSAGSATMATLLPTGGFKASSWSRVWPSCPPALSALLVLRPWPWFCSRYLVQGVGETHIGCCALDSRTCGQSWGQKEHGLLLSASLKYACKRGSVETLQVQPCSTSFVGPLQAGTLTLMGSGTSQHSIQELVRLSSTHKSLLLMVMGCEDEK